jgi:hypothetical protein
MPRPGTCPRWLLSLRAAFTRMLHQKAAFTRWLLYLRAAFTRWHLYLRATFARQHLYLHARRRRYLRVPLTPSVSPLSDSPQLHHFHNRQGYQTFAYRIPVTPSLVCWYFKRCRVKLRAPQGQSCPCARPIQTVHYPASFAWYAACQLPLLMSGFKFGFNISGENDAGDTRNEADECAATAAAPAVEVAVAATLAAPIGPLQDVALGSDILIRLRVRGTGIATWCLLRQSLRPRQHCACAVQSLNSDSATHLIGNPDLAASDLLPKQYEGAPTIAHAKMFVNAACRALPQVAHVLCIANASLQAD